MLWLCWTLNIYSNYDVTNLLCSLKDVISLCDCAVIFERSGDIETLEHYRAGRMVRV